MNNITWSLKQDCFIEGSIKDVKFLINLKDNVVKSLYTLYANSTVKTLPSNLKETTIEGIKLKAEETSLKLFSTH